ncbi:peroxidase 28-like [Curcuma longa]|uniref:peroxidase 28-like n=1 Tax=Curcuma longa TaxID=136217 RepID=UPI003D9EF5F9
MEPLCFPLFLLLLLFLTRAAIASSSLRLNFYNESCPRAELIVKQVVLGYFLRDPSIPAGLLRLHFHDCFIRGCDASILLDSTDDNVAEKEAPPNLTIRGLDLIDDAKAALEAECPHVVSCADIIALAARDGVALVGGEEYKLPTGRRDGFVSRMADVRLPTPSFSVEAAQAAFERINLTLVDLTTLLGAHSIGFCHCVFFIGRLYNFKNTGFADPRINPTILEFLQQKCPPQVITFDNVTRDPKLFMNPESNSSSSFGNSFYRGVLEQKVLLGLDQDLAFTDLTEKLVVRYVEDRSLFMSQFSASMVRLGNVGVLAGTEGEVRLNCSKTNNSTVVIDTELN